MQHFTCEQNEKSIAVTGQSVAFTYDAEACTWGVSFPGSPYPATKNIGAEVLLRGKKLSERDFARAPAACSVEETSDCFGGGLKVTALRPWGDVDIAQCFRLVPDMPWMLAWIELRAVDIVQSARMAPVATRSSMMDRAAVPFSLGDAKRPRLLFVPYDNDKWIRFEAQKIHGAGSSYEVTAVYDDDTRNGYVIGSVTHDHWKTGIATHGGHGKLEFLNVVGGVADFVTRDEAMPHGPVRGKTVSSPVAYIGYHPDFRDGLTEFARVNTLYAPALPWTEGVPFGWNSFAALGGALTLKAHETAGETLAALKENGFHNGGVSYVNYDAMWQRLTPQELKQSVDDAHARGQRAGVYFAPFACWPFMGLDKVADFSDGRYTYRDMAARDEGGNILPPCDGGIPLDATHPGVLLRIENMMKFTIDNGFDYIKTDFMAHGAMECVHYDSTVTTGIEAYNLAMRHMLSFIAPEKAGRTIFLDFSIAPIFPYQYCHARRVSCDAFGLIDDTEYMLNSVTYGFWQSGTIYAFNDPDHTVLYKSFNKPEISTPAEARSRLNASVIGGTVMLLSDDFENPDAVARVKEVVRPELMDIARVGRTFLPVETATGDSASRLFTRADEGRNLLAVFNFTDEPCEIAVDAARLALPASDKPFTNVAGGEAFHGERFLIPLAARDSMILEQRL